MAAPNIVNVTSILGQSSGTNLNNTADSDLNVLQGITDKVLKVNIMRVTNVHTSVSDAVTVKFVHDSAGDNEVTHLLTDVVIPIRQSLPVLEGSIYLTEEDKIVMSRTNTSALSADSDSLQAFVSYEILDDA